MSEKADFYVYCHRSPSQELVVGGVVERQTPFYVGKGRRNRAWGTENRSKWWHAHVNRYCPSGPEVVILQDGLSEELAHSLERFWIALFGRRGIHSGGTLVNLTDGGEGNSGWVPSETTRRKMSARHAGKTISDEQRRMISAHFKGKKLSEEHRKKISLAQLGKKVSAETVEKIRATKASRRAAIQVPRVVTASAKQTTRKVRLGRSPTAETRAKISEANRGRRLSSETRQRMSQSHRGKVFSDDHRMKIAESNGAVPADLISPLGKAVLVVNRSAFCRDTGLDVSGVCKLISGKLRQYKGWRLADV